MNKDYLPFYESLKDDDKEFWLNCSKEELIDHIVSNIRNGETLLLRINKALYESGLLKSKYISLSCIVSPQIKRHRLINILMHCITR